MALGLLVLALLVLVPHVPDRRIAASDPTAGLSLREMVARGEALVAQRRSREALPYYYRLIELTDRRNAGMHFAYALTLFNSVFELEDVRGVPRSSWRTSDGRVTAMGECIAHMDTAIALAANPRERARFENRLGSMLLAWGFPLESRSSYLASFADDPGQAVVARQLDALLETLRDPVHARGLREEEGNP